MDTLITRLNDQSVRYLVIGGQAVRLHGLPRFSMDWDILIPPHDPENVRRITDALGDELDVELLPLGPRGENMIQTYQTRFGIVQFHYAIPGIEGFAAVEGRKEILPDEDGVLVTCLSARDLLAAKRATNRPQDQQDIVFLEALTDHQP